MPDAYLHLRTARAALADSTLDFSCDSVYLTGANGPDPLFAYDIFRRKLAPGANTLGHRLHTEHCGVLLCALAALSHSDIQRRFAAGYLTHATLDAALHPYIAYHTEAEGSPYDVPGGHCKLETALDTFYYRKDSGKRFGMPALSDSCPTLAPDELGEICALLRDAVQTVYSDTPDFLELTDCYHRFRFAHRFFRSRLGVKKLFAHLADAVLRSPGSVSGRMQPRRLSRDLLDGWYDAGTNTEYAGGVEELLPAATALCTARLNALDLFWQGRQDLSALANALGNQNYMTGLPCTNEK